MTMSIVSIEEVQNHLELVENEDNSLIKLDLKDQIALGGGSENEKEIIQLNKKEEYQDISSCLSNNLPMLFLKVYDTKVVNSMEEYGMHLLRYFKVLKDTSPDKYGSFNKIINSALEYKKALNDLKIAHGNLASKFGIIRTRLTDSYPICLKAILSLTDDDNTGNSSGFDNILSMLNFDNKLEECRSIYDSLEQITTKFNSIYDYNQNERENLSIILGSDNVKEILDNYDEQIRAFKEKIKSANESLSCVKKKKFENDSGAKFSKVKIDQLDNLIKQKQKQLDDMNKETEQFKKNKDSNMDTKKKMLDFFYDPEKNKEYLMRQKAIRQQFDDQYAKSLLEINKQSKELFDDIKNVKVVQKSYSIIFILDESGSMAPHFKTVITSVGKVIDKRKKEPITKDKVSIIKFNSKAVIEHINVDIKEDITISELRGDCTSFIEPLKKLGDVLSQIDKDLFIPIVFFLSDGYGERRSDVLNFVKMFIKNFQPWICYFSRLVMVMLQVRKDN